MGDARYVRSNRLLDGPAGHVLAIRCAQQTHWPSVTIQTADPAHPGRPITSILRLAPAEAATLGAQLIAAASVAEGRLDQADVVGVQQAAADEMARQILADRARNGQQPCPVCHSTKRVWDPATHTDVPCRLCCASDHALARAMAT